MENIKLILKKIEDDLSRLEILIDKSLISQTKNDNSDGKILDNITLEKIHSNLNNLDEIIKDLDENY